MPTELMTRSRTTALIDQAGRTGGTAFSIERALRDVPGVIRAYVNPATAINAQLLRRAKL